MLDNILEKFYFLRCPVESHKDSEKKRKEKKNANGSILAPFF